MKKVPSLFRIPATGLIGYCLLASGLSSVACGRQNAAEGHDAEVRSDTGTRGTADPFRAKIERYVNAAEKDWGFQGSVLIARGDEVIFKKGLGAADLEKEVPNSPKTRFLIASITKVLTATAVMKLAENGKIGLEDSAVRYLPDLKDVLGRDVRISHLLSHSSGLPEFSPGAAGEMKVTEPVGPRALIDAIRGREPLFAPGRDVRYSNIGYVVLGLVIEKATGEVYYDWLIGHVLKTLGMNDTGMCADYPFRPDFARGYVEDRGGELHPAPFIHPSWGYSAGALYSTVEDLFKFDRALSSPGFLASGSLEAMFRARFPSFCFGWLVNTVFGRRSYAHGGGAPGYSAWIERWPEDDAFVAVLSNVTGAPAGEIGRSLAAAVFGEAYAMPARRAAIQVPPAQLREFAGSYRTENGEVRRIILEGDSLFAVRGSGPGIPILPYDKDSFFFPMDKGAFIRFARDGQGRVSGQILHQLGVDESALKINR